MDKLPLRLTLLKTIQRLWSYFISWLIAGHNIGESYSTGHTHSVYGLPCFVGWNRRKLHVRRKYRRTFYSYYLFQTLEEIKFNTAVVTAVTSKFQIVKDNTCVVSYKNVATRLKMAAISNILSHDKRESVF